MFEEKDAKFLKQRIMEGNVVLFLGAGASHGSLNSHGKPVYKARELEDEFRNYLDERDVDLDIGELAADVMKASEAD